MSVSKGGLCISVRIDYHSVVVYASLLTMMKRARKITRRVPPDPPVSKGDLQEWRTLLGWTQFQAADWFRVSLSTYESWEHGRRSPSDPSRIRRLMGRAKLRKPDILPQEPEPTLF